VDKVIGLKNLRTEIIIRIVESRAFSNLISHILYKSIKGYLLSENVLLAKFPLVPSLLKFSREALQRLLPPIAGLESAIDRRLEAYIESIGEKTIRNSREFLNEFIDDNLILETGEEIWEAVFQNSLAEYFSKIDTNDLEDFILIGYDFWLHFRQTDYFKEIYQELVIYFFKKYGDKELDLIIEDVGVSKEMIIREIIEVVTPGVEKALAMGHLEERVRARLADFYFADATAAVVMEKGAGNV
jgi:hypothetical protein